jgi:hypothetical protein
MATGNGADPVNDLSALMPLSLNGDMLILSSLKAGSTGAKPRGADHG